MIAFITAGLGVSDVILHCDHLNVLLISDHIRNTINIGREGTYDTDSRNIIDVLYHIIYSGFLSVTLQLFDNAFGGLNARLNVFDGIVLVYMLEFIIQDLHLRLHLTQCCTVYQCNLLPAVDSVPVFYLKLHIPSQSILSHKIPVTMLPYFLLP